MQHTPKQSDFKHIVQIAAADRRSEPPLESANQCSGLANNPAWTSAIPFQLVILASLSWLHRCYMRIAQANSPQRSTQPAFIETTEAEPENGDRSEVNGLEYIRYDGYWIRYYEPLEESLASRKTLIDHLTRRAFHHTEPGINTPGDRLDTARTFFQKQTDPALKRVNAAMLAGALFNRATDIFTAVVELEEKGVRISRDNELMKSCGDYFKEALDLGKQVRHFSGEEGIDELWGEPFRAFTLPITAYYESRFIKVAQAMANIDRLAKLIESVYCPRPEFSEIGPLVNQYATSAKHECETMKSDVHIFDIWPRFVADGEALGDVIPRLQPGCSNECQYVIEEAQKTLIAGRNLINWIARARVPMPHSTEKYIRRVDSLRERLKDC